MSSFKCVFRCCDREDHFRHCLQKYGFSPECVPTLVFMEEAYKIVFKHSLQNELSGAS